VGRGSPRGSRARVVSEDEVVYISTERDRGGELRRQSTRGERPRGSAQFLTTSVAATGYGSRDDVIDDFRYVEASRQNLFLEDRDRERERSRNITYATSPRLSRERVVIDEGGRRKEIYQITGGR
jgi:hypothetical protein